MTTEAQVPETAGQGTVIATGAKYYRRTRYLMVAMLLIYGGLSIKDGFFLWPHWTDTHPNEKPKTQMDIMFNQVLGIALPPLAITLLLWCRYNSRGEIRLEDGVVYVPGHPPVPLQQIHLVHRELWDRKGIADVDYDVGSGDESSKGSFRLDDYVYERDPIDEIFGAIETAVGASRTVRTAPPSGLPVARNAAATPRQQAMVPAQNRPVQTARMQTAPAQSVPSQSRQVAGPQAQRNAAPQPGPQKIAPQRTAPQNVALQRNAATQNPAQARPTQPPVQQNPVQNRPVQRPQAQPAPVQNRPAAPPAKPAAPRPQAPASAQPAPRAPAPQSNPAAPRQIPGTRLPPPQPPRKQP